MIDQTQLPVAIARQYARALEGHSARFEAAWGARTRNHGNLIRFDRPSRTVSVSLTGAECALKCAHCGGRYLEHMHPIWDAHAENATSCLISGGCDPSGRVPVAAHLDAVRTLHQGRRLNWHVGFIGPEEVERIHPYVDMVSLDMVGDRETAQEVYGLDLGLDDYLRTYDMLRARVPVVPHITIGLRAGRLSGERNVLEALVARNTSAVVFIILIPTEGTAFADVEPPDLALVSELFLEARLALPAARLYLGCMRPYGAYRQAVDDLAVSAGLNVIVNPARSAVLAAEARGLEIIWGDECCALD